MTQRIWTFLQLLWQEWSADDGSRLAATLAYYTIFSLSPMMIIAVAAIGLIFGREAAQGHLLRQIDDVIGHEGASLIQTLIANTQEQGSGVLATVVGIVTLLFGATTAFSELQSSLNRIWNVPSPQARSLWYWLRTRLLSFTIMAGSGLLLLISLVLGTIVTTLGDLITSGGINLALWGQIANFFISLLVTTLLFAMIFKVLPDIDIAWSDVWIGAAFTALLFSIGRLLITLYLGYSSPASTYGAAGSLVVILLWVYYSAQILFLGAEFTQVYARLHGTHRHIQTESTAQ